MVCDNCDQTDMHESVGLQKRGQVPLSRFVSNYVGPRTMTAKRNRSGVQNRQAYDVQGQHRLHKMMRHTLKPNQAQD